jgi:hypothetical protein
MGGLFNKEDKEWWWVEHFPCHGVEGNETLDCPPTEALGSDNIVI